MKKIAEDKKRLLSNFFSLSILHGVTMILPLITLPYLVRVLGVETFGLINFALAIIMYFNIFTGFGFALSATREISIHRDDAEKVSEIFFSVMILKTILLLVSLLILSGTILLFDNFRENMQLYYITFGLVVGNVLFPSWFFQGVEQMKYITYINLATKIFFTIFIFILVQDASDYIYVPLLNSLGVISAGVISLWIVFKHFAIQFSWPSRQFIVELFKDSYLFFLSRVANDGSRYYAITLIGLYFGNTMLGYYAMVEKLYHAYMSLGGIVAQTIYPYMARTKNIIFLKKILFLVILGASFILLPTLYFRMEIMDFVFNINNEMQSNLFLIIFSGSVLGIASAILGYPVLAAFGYINYANNSLIYTALIYIIFITVALSLTNSIYMAAFAIVVKQTFSLLFRVYYIKKTKIWNISS